MFTCGVSFIVDIRKNGETDTTWLYNRYEECRLTIMESDKTGYLMIKGLEANTSYEIDLQMEDMLGLKSNLLQYSFNTSDYKKFILGGKYTRNDNNSNISNNSKNISSFKTLNAFCSPGLPTV